MLYRPGILRVAKALFGKAGVAPSSPDSISAPEPVCRQRNKRISTIAGFSVPQSSAFSGGITENVIGMSRRKVQLFMPTRRRGNLCCLFLLMKGSWGSPMLGNSHRRFSTRQRRCYHSSSLPPVCHCERLIHPFVIAAFFFCSANAVW